MTLRGGSTNGSIRAWRRHFTLNSVDDVVNLLREILLHSEFKLLPASTSLEQLRSHGNELPHSDFVNELLYNPENLSYQKDPNLAFVSIVLGYIENKLTVGQQDHHHNNNMSKFRSHTSGLISGTYSNNQKNFPARSNSSRPSGSHTNKPNSLSIHVEELEHCTDNVANMGKINHNLVCDLPESTASSASSSVCSVVTDQESRPDLARQSNANNPRRSRRRNLITPDSPSLLPSLHMKRDASHMASGHDTSASGSNKKRRFSDATATTKPMFPTLSFEDAEQLYQEFHTLVTTSPKLMPYSQAENVGPSCTTTPVRWSTPGLIRAVCETLWSHMTIGRLRERLTHTQTIYAFLTAGTLDSFGLAYTTVAACQLLGYSDVDLALSEDHGWVEFGPPESRQTADVASWVQSRSQISSTGHDTVCSRTSSSDTSATSIGMMQNRNTDDGDDDAESINKLPPPPAVRLHPLTYSWLYVNGYPVICRPRMLAVAAAVAAIQPGAFPSALLAHVGNRISDSPTPGLVVTENDMAKHLSTSTGISLQLVTLKHRLLWLFFDAGCLSRYPLALTNLGDLEDAFPTVDRQSLLDSSSITETKPESSTQPSTQVTETKPPLTALLLYQQAVTVNQCYYANQHVYPYTCLAGCLYRHGNYAGALRSWADAAQVIGHYNHSSEDLEIYRELLEVATNLMPHMFRHAAESSRSCSEGLLDTDPDGCVYQLTNILDDPQCLAHLITFYDHLCLWEEGSTVPVLHVGWVDKLMVNLARFSNRARRLLRLTVYSPEGTDSKQLESNTSPAIAPISSISTSTTLSVPGSVISDRFNGPMSDCSPVWSRGFRRRLRHSSATSATSTASPRYEVVNKTSRLLDEVAQEEVSVKSETNKSLHDDRICKPDQDAASPSTVTQPMTRGQRNRITKCDKIAHRKVTENIQEISLMQPFSDQDPVTEIIHATVTPLNSLTVIPEVVDQPEAAVDEILMEEADTSPSPPPLVDFPPTSEDLLSSLVDACDQHLLNPAFLCNFEPDMPFLPPNVAPEEVFSRLSAAFKIKSFIIPPVTSSLFPTPPTSGDLCELLVSSSSLDYEKQQHGLLTDDAPPTEEEQVKKNNDDLFADVNTATVMETESQSHATFVMDETTTDDKTSLDLTMFPTALDTSDNTGLNLLEDDTVPSELIDSVADLVNEQEQQCSYQPEQKDLRVNSTDDIFNLMFQSDDPVSSDTSQNGIVETNASVTQSPCTPEPAAAAIPTAKKTMEELMITLSLRSVKMISIIDLLRATRLNASAIKLALTAQSQVCLRRSSISLPPATVASSSSSNSVD